MRNLWKRTACGLLAALMLLGAGCSGQPAASPAPAETTPVPSETAEQAKTTTFVDDLGRELELELPITRACVANRYNNELPGRGRRRLRGGRGHLHLPGQCILAPVRRGRDLRQGRVRL
ncbi:hypothetical protein AAAT94_09565 [Intestinimonas aquisgranensis]|nr:hypothetical protein [Intestinimonas aquisgranensis]